MMAFRRSIHMLLFGERLHDSNWTRVEILPDLYIPRFRPLLAGALRVYGVCADSAVARHCAARRAADG